MSRRHHMFLLEGVYFISFCTLYAYTVTILLEYGYTEVQCGYITMLQYVMMTIAGPVYGRMIDCGLSPKKLFIILAAGGIIVTPLLPVCFAKDFSLTMISFGIISALDFCGATVIDTWINQMTLRDETIDYGMIRSAGSIFYATTAIVSGYLIVPLGINFLFWLHMGSLAVAILLAVTFADPNKLPLLEPDRFAGEVAPDETFAQSIRTMMKNRPFVIFLICGTMYYFATRAVNGFMQVIINYIGGDASTYGVSVFLYCVGEFLLMRLASRLLRRGMKLPVLFITATAGLGLRILLLGVLKTMTGVMLTQILLSVGFASYLRFNIDYVASLFPRQYAGRAILISVAVTQGLGSIIGNLAGGYLLASVGVPVYCFICGGAMFLSMAIFLMGKPFSAAK